MREKILQAMKNRGLNGVSFVELERELGEDMKGDYVIALEHNPNVVLWINVSSDFADAFNLLVTEGKIIKTPASILVYVSDGKMLRLPIVKTNRIYKREHWLPITMKLVENSVC